MRYQTALLPAIWPDSTPNLRAGDGGRTRISQFAAGHPNRLDDAPARLRRLSVVLRRCRIVSESLQRNHALDTVEHGVMLIGVNRMLLRILIYTLLFATAAVLCSARCLHLAITAI